MLARASYRLSQHIIREEFSKNESSADMYKVSEKKKPNIMDYLQNREIRS